MSALIIFIVILVVFIVLCIAYKCLENSSMATVRQLPKVSNNSKVSNNLDFGLSDVPLT
jgi:hypothetical protein